MLKRPSLLLSALLLSVLQSTGGASEGWYSTYEEARSVADSQGLPLLVHFHAVYCGPCRQMTQQVFSQPDVQRQLRDGIVAVEVDVAQRRDIADIYGATTVPRDVVIYPGKSPETVNMGFKSNLAYLALLKEISAKGQKSRPSKIPLVAETPKSESPNSAARPLVVGLDGFCPVRLMKSREWVSGRRELATEHRGITYYFSGENERQEFMKDQTTFAPQNLGCDPIVLLRDQRAVVGQITYGVFFDNQLYLFETPENRLEFKENPLKFTRIRHAVRIDELGQRQVL